MIMFETREYDELEDIIADFGLRDTFGEIANSEGFPSGKYAEELGLDGVISWIENHSDKRIRSYEEKGDLYIVTVFVDDHAGRA